jgi:hypothetical protein
MGYFNLLIVCIKANYLEFIKLPVIGFMMGEIKEAVVFVEGDGEKFCKLVC